MWCCLIWCVGHICWEKYHINKKYIWIPANTGWPSKRLQDISWRRLQHVFSVTIFRLPRRLANTSWRRLEDVLEDEKLLRWRRLEDVLEINKMFTRISVLIHGLLRNLNQYLTNLYLTNLYFTNLRWIQNALIRTQ